MTKKIVLVFFAVLFLSSCFWSSGESWQSSNSNSDMIDSQESMQIFALWDSLTAGYWLPVEDSYPSILQWLLDENFWNYQVINAWVSWNTSAELQSRLDWVLSDAEPWDIAILVIGGNDWLRGMSLNDLESNVISIIDILLDNDMSVVLWGMQIPPNLWLSYTREFESLYWNIAQEYRDIYFMEFFLDEVAANPSLNLPDMIHPNRDWYKIVAQNVYDFLVSNNLVWLR